MQIKLHFKLLQPALRFNLRFTLFGLSYFCLLPIATAQFYNYPGGVVDLTIAKESSELPDVKYGLKNVTILDRGNQWRVLIGIDLNTLPGDYLLYIKQPGDDKSAYDEKFIVAQKKPLIIQQGTSISYPAIQYHDTFSDIGFSNTVEPALPLIFPAQGQWDDLFGAIEISADGENTQTRNYLSLSSTKILTVIAPQNGIVSRLVATQGPQFMPRNNSDTLADSNTKYTIFLDHGRGLYSILSGVMDITIEAGNGVQGGAVLGKIYAQDSARNQASTLIWQTVLNDAYINPALLTELR